MQFPGISQASYAQATQAFPLEPPQEVAAFPGSDTSQRLEVIPTRVMIHHYFFSSGTTLAAI